jgi:OmpA-OmpF porin, OOP family
MIMINFKKALIASLVALSASSVMAHENGFYLGAGAGYSELDDVCNDYDSLLVGASSKCDDDDNAWSVFGGYLFNPNFALELGYSDLGNFGVSASDGTDSFDLDVDLTAIDLSGVGILPLNDMFSLYARGGYSWVNADVDFDSTFGSADGDDDEGSWVYGAGVGANVTDNLELRADWRRYQDVMDSDDVDLDVYSLLAIYHFGPHAAPVAAPAEEVSLNIQVLFDTDKSVIKPEFEGEIQKAVDFLTAHPEAKAVVEGHTDSTASDAYNQGLSERRANSVMSALVAKGIDAGRLSAVGYGEAKPVADNATKEGRAQNRRVVAEFSGVSIKAN